MTISEAEGRRPGRPRGFEHDTVLAAATDLFWTKGFAATSVPDISAATGLSTSSLYNAFGSKLDLFTSALDRYLDTIIDEVMLGPLDRGTAGLDDVEAYLGRLDRTLALRPVRGCLVINTLTEFRDPPDAVAQRTREYRRSLRRALRVAFARAEARGEVPQGVARARADSLAPLVIAFNLLVTAGAPRAEARGVLAAARTLAAAA